MVMNQPPAVIVIEQDMGGSVGDYIFALMQTRKNGSRVELRGPCASACTIWTAMPKDKLCVGPQAGLGFHKTNPAMGDQQASDGVVKAYYPLALKQLVEQIDLTYDLTWLFGSKLRTIFNRCPSI